jgi:hypothetical protein
MLDPGVVPGRRYLLRLAWVALAASVVDVGASVVLDGGSLGQPARLGVALLPLPGCIALLVTAIQVVRRLDEFQKRVQFEAVVIGFLSTGVVVFVYGYLQKAHAVGPINLGVVWLSMIVFYAIGYIVAVRHYQ